MYSGKDIEIAGWRQGSLIDLQIIDKDALSIPENVSYAIIASHSCDLVSNNFNEIPEIFALPVHYQEKNPETDGTYFNGNNARTLLLPRDTSNIKLQIKEIFKIPRKALLHHNPIENMDFRESQNFAGWLGRTFNRSSFPTAFNDRFTHSRDPLVGKAINKLNKFIKKNHHLMSAILIKLDCWEEQVDAQDYQLEIAVIVPLEHEASRDVLAGEFDQLMTNICDATTGIDLISADVYTADSFTFADLMTFKIWNFEHLSVRDELPVMEI